MGTDQLYQDEILRFARLARASTRLDAPAFTARVKNPSCGDVVDVDLMLDADGRVSEIGVATQGCALCEASAGLLLAVAPGRQRDDFPNLHDRLAAWLAHAHDDMMAPEQKAFLAVRDFTSRHTCVCMPFKAAALALS